MPLTGRNSFHNEARSSSIHLSRISELDDLLDSDYEGLINNAEDTFIRKNSDALSGKSVISSLEDVCLPLNDNQDSDPAVDEHGNKIWPDLKALQEFSNQELQELAEIHAVEDSIGKGYTRNGDHDEYISRHYRYNDDDDDDYTTDQTESDIGHPNIAFKTPIVSKVDVISKNSKDYQPLLSHKVNEAEGLDGRLRPPRIYPWSNQSKSDNSNKNAANAAQRHRFNPPIVNKDHLLDDFRFAYFREDLDTTIHSPNISGILQPGQTFADLFVSSVYSKNATALPRSLSPFKTVEASNSSIASKINEKHIFWLDVLNPTEDEIKVIAKSFGLHSLTAEDILLGESREKVEVFNNYYFICFRSFDVVHEKLKIRVKKALDVIDESDDSDDSDDENYFYYENGKLLTANQALSKRVRHFFTNFYRKIKGVGYSRRKQTVSKKDVADLLMRHKKRYSSTSKFNELQPLNIYIVVFKEGVLTFHFNSTPHPVNVRRRCRLLRDYLNVSSDWIAYALIDDITDAFFPMIELLESEVHAIEDEIIKMQTKDSDDESEDSDCDFDSSSDDESEYGDENTRMSNYYYCDKKSSHPNNNFSYRKRRLSRRSSTAGAFGNPNKSYAPSVSSSSAGSSSTSSSSSRSSSSSMASNATFQWQKKNDMLRRIGECRKKVMILSRLLGFKADVIKGFSKRFGGNPSSNNTSKVSNNNTNTVLEDAYDMENNSNFDHRKLNSTAISHENSELGMYLGDIQDHVITMVQTLNHCEKLLSRAHSNYLAQINIDMTKVNNDMNDVLGKLTILGTIVLPMNVVTGLWGMNVEVPGQFQDTLMWFTSITSGLIIFGIILFFVAKKIGVA